ncbi:MAG: hypothetical protein IH804_02225 [Planctomycetes bacterium]|nr:hypothetical protein [Planctomycetota bacterium]
MIRRFEIADRAPATKEPHGAAPASIESWLALFGRLLRLPEPERQAIRDELEHHLRARVRDLVLGGERETDALRLAIAELGSAADLADRFRIATRPTRRRLIMNTAVIGIAAASIVTAGLVVSSPSRGPGPVYYQAPTVADERPALEEIAVSVEFNETPLAEVLSYFGKLLESDVIVYWCVLEECGISRDAPVTLVLEHKRPLSQVLDLVAQSAARPDWPPIDWRYGDDLFEFSTREYFDRRETVMSSFDVGEILARIDEEHSVVRFESIQDDFSTVLEKLNIPQVRPLPRKGQTAGRRGHFSEFYGEEIRQQAVDVLVGALEADCRLDECDPVLRHICLLGRGMSFAKERKPPPP